MGGFELKRSLAIVIAVTIAVSACFALGLFDGDGVVSVDGQDFMEFTYSGDLRDGLFDGPGSIQFNEGERFDGYFSEGRFNGTGEFFGAEDEWNFSGVFRSGRISGGILNTDRGEAVTLERSEVADTLIGEIWLFDGSFNDRGQTGEGTFVFADDSVYTGGFSHGLADGEGTYTNASGRMIYQGGFKEGFFDGQGAYYSADGWSYSGSFTGGMLNGEGVMTLEDETIRGVWEMGVQVARYE